MALGSEFQVAIECKLRLGSRNRRFHWTCSIELQLEIPFPLMFHGWCWHLGFEWGRGIQEPDATISTQSLGLEASPSNLERAFSSTQLPNVTIVADQWLYLM